MRIKETKLYTYAELSDSAKAKARDWYRESANTDFADYGAEYVTEDFHETLKAFGFDVYQRRGNYLDPRDSRANRSTVAWSGFWNQGDGASFSGSWRASDFKPDALLENRPVVWPAESGGHECPSNKELHRIAGELRACVDAGLTFATVVVRGRSFFMACDECEWSEEKTADDSDLDSLQESFIEAARDLATGFYRALEAEYEYQNADEQVAENIICTGYEFTEEGERA